MTAISRRTLLGGLAGTAGGVIGTAIPLPAPAAIDEQSAPAEKPFDLQEWLDTAEKTAVVRYHAASLAEAMAVIDPSRSYRDAVDYKGGFALIVGDPIDGRRLPVAKVHIDDGSPLFADDVTGTTAFADWERGVRS
jgi:hypothetical protein